MTKIIRFALAAALLASCSFASTLSPVLSGSPLAATDTLDWGQVGPDLTVVPGPFNVTSLNSVTVGVANGTNEFWGVQQGNTWGGNFANGDNLIYNQAGGPVTLTFGTVISGFAARFQALSFGPMTVLLTAFGVGDTDFGTVSASGTSSGAGDGSALYFGVQGSSADIVKVVVDVQVGEVSDPFAIGTLETTSAVPGSATPEPSTMLLAAAGVLAGLARGYTARRK